MATAEELKNQAQKVEEDDQKSPPAYKSPMTTLIEPLQRICADFRQETGVTFSTQTQLLWVDFLNREGWLKRYKLDPEELKKDITTRRKGGGVSTKELKEKEDENAQLKALLAEKQAQIKALQEGKK